MDSGTRLVALREVTFIDPQPFVGWGGDGMRMFVRDVDANITLDRALREIDIEPRKRGDGFTVPVTAVKQWKVKLADTVDSVSTATAAGGRAKAPATSAAKSST